MKKRFIAIVCIVLLLGVLGLILYDPRSCPICCAEKTDIPCLIDLRTGKIGELWVGSRELSDDPSTFVFYMIEVADCGGYCDTATRCCHITLGDERKAANPFLFCHSCRMSLWASRNERYAILDLREPKAEIYSTANGSFDIGDFHIDSADGSLSVSLEKRTFEPKQGCAPDESTALLFVITESGTSPVQLSLTASY